jgi:PAS domain-containing protein
MKKNTKSTGPNSLQPKMEELLKEVLFNKFLQISDSESQKVLQDLKMQKVALELQNEELKKTIVQLVSAFKRYTELNDFESSAFISLTKEGRIQEVNRNAFNLLGKEHFRAKGNLLEIFLAEESKSVFHQFLKSVFQNGRIESCEVVLISGEQSTYVHLSGLVINGGEQCLIGVLNITDQKEWEETLHQNEIRLQTLAQMIPDLGWIKDSYEVILSCNKELEGLFSRKGKMLNNVFGVRGTGMISKNDHDFVDQGLIELMQQRFHQSFEPEKKKLGRKKKVLSIVT